MTKHWNPAHNELTPLLLLPETPFNDMTTMGNGGIILQFLLQFGLLVGEYKGPWSLGERWNERWLLVHGDATTIVLMRSFLESLQRQMHLGIAHKYKQAVIVRKALS
jgi:hypothetical protein